MHTGSMTESDLLRVSAIYSNMIVTRFLREEPSDGHFFALRFSSIAHPNFLFYSIYHSIQSSFIYNNGEPYVCANVSIL